ncbi:MAG: cytochrome c [Flavobacteriales bacterium]|nr:cytochrome c [Flavobacteriales bacterium]
MSNLLTSSAAAMVVLCMMTACGGGDAANAGPPGAPTLEKETSSSEAASSSGKAKLLTDADVTLGDIDNGMVEKGKTTYDVKCQACHSMGENRVVGPGWKGITTRRKPEWIMNMIVNTDAMLAEDPEAQRQLEQCLVRMPNQNLSMDEARQVLEFMRTL